MEKRAYTNPEKAVLSNKKLPQQPVQAGLHIHSAHQVKNETYWSKDNKQAIGE
jgi:hypothetical protein